MGELDSALFVALFAGIVGTVFAMGEPESVRERAWRIRVLVICGVISVIMVMWLIVRIVEGVVTLLV